MADQWLHMYHQNNHLSNQPSLQLSDDHHELNNNNINSGLVSDSTVVTAAVSPATTPPASSSLSPDRGRVGKPVRKRSRASRRTPTTLLNTDAANFRAMVQQFTGGPSNNANNVHDFAFGLFPGGSHPAVFDPAATYHLPVPPQQPPLFQYQNQPQPPSQPPFMFSLSNTAASDEALFFQTQRGGSRNNVNYNMGLFDGSSTTAQHPRPS